MSKKINFTKSLDKLLEASKKIAEMTRPNVDSCKTVFVRKIEKPLNKYIEIIKKFKETDKSIAPIHSKYFAKLYNSHKGEIVLGPPYSWLRDGNVKITFGEGNEGCTGKIYINLSSLFNNSIKYDKEHEKEGEATTSLTESFLLPLYQIFLYIAKKDKKEDEDITKLKDIIEKIRDFLSDDTLDSPDGDSKTSKPVQPDINFTDIMGPILKSLTESLPKDDPDCEGVTNVLSSKEMNEFIENLGNKAKDVSSPQDYIKLMTGLFNDPKLKSMMFKQQDKESHADKAEERKASVPVPQIEEHKAPKIEELPDATPVSKQ